jgi:ABC-2 type transport system permease protein
MSAVLTIARTESRRIFVSPLAWAVLAVMQFILGGIFWLLLIQHAGNDPSADQYTGLADFISGGLYGFAMFLLLMVAPLLTMRLFSEERKSGSLTLLLAAPVTLTELVLGKFLGLFSFFLVLLLLLAVMPLTLLLGTPLDLGRIAAGLLGLALLMAAFGSAGLFISTLTKEPTIAAIGGFALLLVLWLLELISTQPVPFASAIGYLALTPHFESLRRGIFNSADVVYYLLFTAFFLWLAVLRLDLERA